ncbi:MAG: glycosyltransferase [Pseudomonadota bacterium]
MTRRLKEFAKHAAPHDMAGREVPPDHVCVLLSLYNGADMISEQLSALAAQTHKRWSLIISDDGSTDAWQETVSHFAETTAPGQIWLMGGANKGHGRNYLSLVLAAGPSVPYVAFCGQNDVWFAEKLARAVGQLRSLPNGRPGLYSSRQVFCDRNLDAQTVARGPRRELSFQNALVQNTCDLATIVLNRDALDLVQDTVRHIRDQVAFDGWIHQLISGAGGEIIFDGQPSQFHRQRAWRANSDRRVPWKPVRISTADRISALNRARHWLTPEARHTLDQLDHARNANLPARLSALRKSGVYGQTKLGTASLWAAAMLNRF